MKKTIMITTVSLLIVGLFTGYAVDIFAKNNSAKSIRSQNQSKKGQVFNRANCSGEDCLAVSNLNYPVGSLTNEAKAALVAAINDEYKAHALYEKTIEKIGLVRPFSMIIRAEEQHISSLKALFDKYGLEIPKNDWPTKVVAQENRQQACQAGVDAEIANAQLYKEKLLPAVSSYEDIRVVFSRLMSASEEKHLTAFEKCN